jgi:hypothetical protein
MRTALTALATSLALLVPLAAHAQPTASAARSCKPPTYPGQGYFTSLKVTGVSCATGRKVTLAHYRCRTRHGIRGRCRTRVLRYRCSEHRVVIATEYDSRVTCVRGARKVVYTYQQNT